MSASPLRVTLSRAWRGFRARARGSAIVLTYHRVGDLSGDPHCLAVSPEHFAQQMDVIAREHTVLSAAELAELMRGRKSLPQRTVVVTFDDGYAETHALAVPVLAALGLRATSYLCSDAVGMSGEYHWDVEGTPSGGVGAPARASRRVLTTEEVAALHSGGVIEIGAHTRSHPRLSHLDASAQRDEIAGSKAALEELLGGGEVRTIAFPHGGSADFDETSVAIAREAGFDAAFTTQPGIVVPWANRFAVPRFHTEDIGGDEFRTLLNGWFDAAR